MVVVVYDQMGYLPDQWSLGALPSLWPYVYPSPRDRRMRVGPTLVSSQVLNPLFPLRTIQVTDHWMFELT